MTADLRKLWVILTPPERHRSLIMLVLVILMALSQTAGVLSIMPFLSVLARPGIIQKNAMMQSVYTRLGFTDPRTFIFALGLSSIVVVGSSAFKTITLHLVNRFTFLLRHSISARLLSHYLHQPYAFFLQHNPNELSSSVLSEIDQLHNGLIKRVSQLIGQDVVALAMMLLLLAHKPFIALSAALIIAAPYGAIHLLVRKRLGHTGQARQDVNQARFKACNEALGGLENVQITHSAHACLGSFQQVPCKYWRQQANVETVSQSPLYMVEAVGNTGLIVLALVLMWRSRDIAQVLLALAMYGIATYRLLPSAQIIYRGFAQLKCSTALRQKYTKSKLLTICANEDSIRHLFKRCP